MSLTISEPKPIPLILDGKFILKEKVGSGSFGQIYIAISKQTGEVMAAKLESKLTNVITTLAKEAKILNELANEKGFPRVYSFGRDTDYNYMTINLLGHDVEKLFKICHYKFSLKTVLMIADQMLTRIEALHSKNYIHRDIKPENFCMSKEPKGELNLIDFGLSRSYRDPNGNHIPRAEKKGLVGTARYASINNHQGLEQSRRDDLESMGYVFVYLMKSKLPWQNMKAKSKQEKYEKIANMKSKTSVSELCSDIPAEFATFINYVRGLGFDETPNYAHMKNIFRDLFKKNGYEYDYEYDWLHTKLKVTKSLHQDAIKNAKLQTPMKLGTFVGKEKPNLNEELQNKEIEKATPFTKSRGVTEVSFQNNAMTLAATQGISSETHNDLGRSKIMFKNHTIAGCSRKVSPVVSDDIPESYESAASHHSSKDLNYRKTMYEEDDEIPIEITFKTSPTVKIQQTKPLIARTKTSYYVANMNFLQPGTARSEVRKRTFNRTFSEKHYQPSLPQKTQFNSNEEFKSGFPSAKQENNRIDSGMFVKPSISDKPVITMKKNYS